MRKTKMAISIALIAQAALIVQIALIVQAALTVQIAKTVQAVLTVLAAFAAHFVICAANRCNWLSPTVALIAINRLS